MFQKMREKINLFVAKSPKKAILCGIMIFDVLFTFICALILIILYKHVNGLAEFTFAEALYNSFLLVLDPGRLEGFIPNASEAGLITVIFCTIMVFVGMVFLSGSIIGYVTTSISDFIESKNNGKNKLLISDHLVIVNWNSRGPEIIQEFLKENKKIKIVVFVPDRKDEIDEEINNRLNISLIQKSNEVYKAAEKLPLIKRKLYIWKNLPKNCITYIVREGDIASATDLDDICISKASNVVILDSSIKDEKTETTGNTQLLKTLILVSEFSKANEKQQILVEVSDPWTMDLVQRVIAFKTNEASEKIIPIYSNMLLGNIYSKIALVPELYDVYEDYLRSNSLAKQNDYHYDKRNILILGHNSMIESFLEEIEKHKKNDEFLGSKDIGHIVVIDDDKNLKEHNNYKDYPDIEVLAADVFDESAINQRVLELSKDAVEETTIFILSDDTLDNEDIDANVLTYLIYIQEEIRRRQKCEAEFNQEKIDVIVEILNSKNKDIVKKYGVDKVITGNSYVSHMISLICMRKQNDLSF